MFIDCSELDNVTDVTGQDISNEMIAGSEGLFDKNLLFTSGVLLAAGTGVAGAALVVSALPAQMLTAATVSGGLIYAGDRKAKGLPIFPFKVNAEDKTAAAPEAVPA